MQVLIWIWLFIQGVSWEVLAFHKFEEGKQQFLAKLEIHYLLLNGLMIVFIIFYFFLSFSIVLLAWLFDKSCSCGLSFFFLRVFARNSESPSSGGVRDQETATLTTTPRLHRFYSLVKPFNGKNATRLARVQTSSFLLFLAFYHQLLFNIAYLWMKCRLLLGKKRCNFLGGNLPGPHSDFNYSLTHK